MASPQTQSVLQQNQGGGGGAVVSQLSKIDVGSAGAVHDAKIDYYGRKLAVAGDDGCVRVWISEERDARFCAELKGHEGPAWGVAWAHPKFPGILASCGHDRSLVVWKDEEAHLETSEQGGGGNARFAIAYRDNRHKASVNGVSFAPEACGLVAGCASSDGTVSIHAFRPSLNPQQAQQLMSSSGAAGGAGGGGAGGQGQWDRTSFTAHPAGVLALAWAPATHSKGTVNAGYLDHCRLVTGGCNNSIRVWGYDPAHSEWKKETVTSDGGSPGAPGHNAGLPQGHRDWVSCVAWRPHDSSVQGGDMIASGGKDGTVCIWCEQRPGQWCLTHAMGQEETNENGERVAGLFEGKPVSDVSFSQIGNILSVSYGDNDVKMFKEESGRRFVELVGLDANGVGIQSLEPAEIQGADQSAMQQAMQNQAAQAQAQQQAAAAQQQAQAQQQAAAAQQQAELQAQAPAEPQVVMGEHGF